MKACVVFDTRYGNTEKVARSLEAGLKAAGLQTTCNNVSAITTAMLKESDLICVGSPTHNRTASESLRAFLGSLEKIDLSGKSALAFDTRRDSFLAGSAAKYIEEALRKRGMKVIGQRISATIVGSESEAEQEPSSKEERKEQRRRNVALREGEESRVEEAGAEIGRTLIEGLLK